MSYQNTKKTDIQEILAAELQGVHVRRTICSRFVISIHFNFCSFCLDRTY